MHCCSLGAGECSRWGAELREGTSKDIPGKTDRASLSVTIMSVSSTVHSSIISKRVGEKPGTSVASIDVVPRIVRTIGGRRRLNLQGLELFSLLSAKIYIRTQQSCSAEFGLLVARVVFVSHKWQRRRLPSENEHTPCQR